MRNLNQEQRGAPGQWMWGMIFQLFSILDWFWSHVCIVCLWDPTEEIERKYPFSCHTDIWQGHLKDPARPQQTNETSSQASKLRWYQNSAMSPSHRLTGVKCRATSVANKKQLMGVNAVFLTMGYIVDLVFPAFAFLEKSTFLCLAQIAAVNWPILGNIRENLQLHLCSIYSTAEEDFTNMELDI